MNGPLVGPEVDAGVARHRELVSEGGIVDMNDRARQHCDLRARGKALIKSLSARWSEEKAAELRAVNAELERFEEQAR